MKDCETAHWTTWRKQNHSWKHVIRQDQIKSRNPSRSVMSKGVESIMEIFTSIKIPEIDDSTEKTKQKKN